MHRVAESLCEALRIRESKTEWTVKSENGDLSPLSVLFYWVGFNSQPLSAFTILRLLI